MLLRLLWQSRDKCVCVCSGARRSQAAFVGSCRQLSQLHSHPCPAEMASKDVIGKGFEPVLAPVSSLLDKLNARKEKLMERWGCLACAMAYQ